MDRNDFKEYLGDGLYARFDGYNIILHTDRAGMEHWVALEPIVYKSLVSYHDRLEEKLKIPRESGQE